MSSKLLVEVVGLDKDGHASTQIIKLPSQHDWTANSAALNKKIMKKFQANDGSYKLQVGDAVVDPSDVHAITQAVKALDVSSSIPQFKISLSTTDGEPDGTQIVVHYEQQQPFTFTVSADLSQLDTAVYDSLVSGIAAHFQIQGDVGKLYEDVQGKPCYVDDWDDLSECLGDLECGEALKLHVERAADDDDEKKEATPKPRQRKYHGAKKKVSLVFVGETGVGKTTLLTSIQDFINRVPFDKVNCTKKPELVGLSQTQDTQSYPLSNDEWAVNIIDTPGIGDTSGADRDQEHMGSIIDFLGDYGDFNAVCILIKRGTTRLSTRMRYIVSELKSNMPKDVQDNFIVIMTRSDVPVPDTDTMAVIEQLNLPTGNIIPVNNNAYEELDLTKYPHGSPIVKIVRSRQRDDYKSNHEYLQILLETASK
jgi:GTP-binding protein EngB required for normal cell division